MFRKTHRGPGLLATNIVKAHEKLGLTQKQLSDAAGLAQATLSRIENSVIRQPGLDKLTKLAKALFVSADALLGVQPDRPIDTALRDPGVQHLLGQYHDLSVKGRETLRQYVSFLAIQESGQRLKGELKRRESMGDEAIACCVPKCNRKEIIQKRKPLGRQPSSPFHVIHHDCGEHTFHRRIPILEEHTSHMLPEVLCESCDCAEEETK